MDANLWTFLGLLVTSLTTIGLALINMKKNTSIENKVDAGNAVTDSVHTLVNGEKARLTEERDAALAEVQRLSRPSPKKK